MPALALLVLATLFWAGNYVVGERVVSTVDPLSLTWWRWVLAVVPLLVLAQVVERPDWAAVARRWRVLLLMGVIGVAGYPLLLYAALVHTTAASASIINAINPVVIVVAAVLLGQATATWRTWAGLALGLLGVLLVITQGDLAHLLALRLNTGDLLMILAVLAWTAYTLIGRRVGIPPLTSTAVQVLLTVLVLTPFTLASGVDVPRDPASWVGVVYIVLGPSIGSYLCWNLAVPKVSATVSGVSMNLVAVFTLGIAALIGHWPTMLQLVGAALVMGGTLLTRRSRGARGPRPRARAL